MSQPLAALQGRVSKHPFPQKFLSASVFLSVAGLPDSSLTTQILSQLF